MSRRNRDIVDILEDHEREIRRLKQALARAGGASGVTDHGALTGLDPDDDHTQYVLASGARDITGTQKVAYDHATDPSLELEGGHTSTWWSGAIRFAANEDAVHWTVGMRGDNDAVNDFLFQSDDSGATDWMRFVYSASQIHALKPVFLNGNELNLGATDDWSIQTAGDDYGVYEGAQARWRIRDDDNDGYFEMFGTGGAEIFRADAGQILTPNGSVTAPGRAFLGDTNTGPYLVSANIYGISTGGVKRAVFQDGGTSGSVGNRGAGVLAIEDVTAVGSATGSITRLLSLGWDTGNDVALEVQAVRDATGSDWQTLAVGIRRVTDSTGQASLWWKGSQIIVGATASTNNETLAVNGTFEAKPDTTGGAANAYWGGGGSGWWYLRHNTSARKYKKHIDYDVQGWLAEVELRPAKFWRDDDQAWYIDFIADDLAEQDELLGVFIEGEVENYHKPGVVAVLAAKMHRAEAKIQSLEDALRSLLDGA